MSTISIGTCFLKPRKRENVVIIKKISHEKVEIASDANSERLESKEKNQNDLK